ncbi:MAG: GTP-binding protein [Limisphaerales bacterium]|nr:MAG: GTP-binding protein [Limisphaerales bacterium]KAG0509603.1 MAG: GTP-binding protein [Limisphaerales bacterium]TXT49791.1 MAG: GTP-binding protein [Limisphaerales bacterium]
MPGLIAIVGRPNVGKSALFNRIAGRRIAIVHDMPGVTRDRVTAEAEWRGRQFTLVDTGGIGLLRGEKVEDVIINAALDQVQIAVEAAHVIILVVNVQEGVVPLDKEVADRLHKSGKPVLVAVNKVDNYKSEAGVTEFAELGFDQIFPVTAIHGRGIEWLMNKAAGYLPEAKANDNPEGDAPYGVTEEEAAAEVEAAVAADAAAGESGSAKPRFKPRTGPVKLAIVGRPNVGKSSIINALTHSERVIVSPIPGTTRDSVDVPFEVETDGVRQQYVLIDTAGLRKARRVDNTVEYFSAQRTEEAINRADIVVFVLDAVTGIVEQDKKIADLIVSAKRACIVVINKWDLVDKSVRVAREEELARREKQGKRHREGAVSSVLTTLAEFGAWVQEKLFFLDYAPVIFTSATSGFQLDRLLEAVRYVGAQLQQQVPTAILNRTLNDAITRRQPISSVGHFMKFFYATQVRQAPPTFLLFVNRDELLSPQYAKYLAGEMRKAFGYEGCPIVLVAKGRPKTVEPVRKFKQRPGGPPIRPKFKPGKRSGLPPERRSGKARAARARR